MRFEIMILKIRIKCGKICDKNVVLCRLSIWIMLISIVGLPKGQSLALTQLE